MRACSEKKILALGIYVIALLLYAAAFVSHYIADDSTVVMFVCLGSTFLCLGTVLKKKYDDTKQE